MIHTSDTRPDAPTDTARAPSSPACDPFAEDLPRPVVLRLLAGRFDLRDLAAYYETAHFRRLRERVIEVYGGCCLCGCRFRKRLTAHHRHYKTLFREDVLQDVSCICRGCHRRHHRN